MKKYDNILLSSKKFKLQRDYWIDNLSGIDEEYILPSARKDNARRNRDGPDAGKIKRIGHTLSPEAGDKLLKLSKNSDETLYVVILSAFISFLNKYTGKHDIALGIPVYKDRDTPSLFNTLLPLRATLNMDSTFKDILLNTREKLLEAYDNQDYPFDRIIEELHFLTDKSYDRLFDLVVAGENIHTPQEISGKRPNLLLYVSRKESVIHFGFQFDGHFFYEDKIESMITLFNRLLETVVNNVSIKQSELEILSGEEKERLLIAFNDTEHKYPRDKTIHRLFEEQVKKTPYNTALEFLDERITYTGLNRRASKLARVLNEKGAGPGSIVGIMVEHSLEMLEGVLGILKAGGAYLPITPGYPAGRISYMIKDSGINILLTQHHLKEKFAFEGECITLDKMPMMSIPASYDSTPGKESHPTDLAYIIYTSGSTGRPKGTLIEHRGLVNYIWAAKQLYAVDKNDIFALYSPLAFDFTITSIYTPLVCGNRIIIYNDDGSEFVINRILRENKVTILKLTPAHLLVLKEMDNRDSNIRVLIVGGEDLKVSLAAAVYRSFGGNIGIYNEYGPTETVVGCAVHKYDFERDRGISVPIGAPIHNMLIYNLDKNLNVLPVGTIGEVFISGAGIARGYLNNPELTGDRFLLNPFRENRTKKTFMYRSGDLAQFLDENKLVYVGRIDHQVSIRGFRIELGEIENRLQDYDGVKDAVVIDWKGKDNIYLCAYFTAGREFSPNELSQYLGKELPDYMIPSYFVKLEKIPLTSSGKVDRKSLPEPNPVKDIMYTPPGDELEVKLVKIWATLLEADEKHIGIHSNFFDLGGHSLSVTQLSAIIQKEFKIKLPMTVLFDRLTIASLKEEIINSGGTLPFSPDEYMVLLKKSHNKDKHFFFIHGGDGNSDVYVKLVENLGNNFNFWGIDAPALNNYAPRGTKIEDIAGEYIDKIKKIQSHGPYRLAGWSAGGVIAFEIASQLQLANEKIEFLGLIDSYPGLDTAAQEYEEDFFSARSEKEIIRSLFNIAELAGQIHTLDDTGSLWRHVMDYLENKNFTPGTLIKFMPGKYQDRIPKNLDTGGLITYINMMRSHDYALSNYMPAARTALPIHYFKANRTKRDEKSWEAFTANKITFYGIESSHELVLKSPAVNELSQSFKRALN